MNRNVKEIRKEVDMVCFRLKKTCNLMQDMFSWSPKTILQICLLTISYKVLIWYMYRNCANNNNETGTEKQMNNSDK
jgi:hypothetical protein